MTCMKYMHKTFLKGKLCVLQVFLCALSHYLCVRTQPHATRRNIDHQSVDQH